MTKSHNNYSLRAACPVEISWISNFTKSWFGVFDMQRSWRPEDNAVNNLKPRSRFEENLSLLVDDLPTDREEATACVSWYICLAVPWKAPHRHQFLLTTHMHNLSLIQQWKEQMAKQAQQVFFADHRAEVSSSPKGPSSLEPSTWFQDCNKTSQRQRLVSTGATLVIPAVSYPKQLTGFSQSPS